LKAVYLDTTPLYATVDKRDQNHGRALALFERLEREGVKAHCPLPTVLELHRLLIIRKPADPGRAHAVAQWALEVFTLVLPTEEHIKEARATLRQFNDQRLTLTDATIAAMASRDGAAVLTFDRHHFGWMGVPVYS